MLPSSNDGRGTARVMKFLRRAAFWFTAPRQAAELAEEIEQHRAEAQAALEARGVPPAEAAAASRRRLGNVVLAREDARGVWIAPMLDNLWKDAVYGARALRREPAFALTALLTLTLGITTAAAVFSVVDSELWRPLPFPEPDHLVVAASLRPGTRGEHEALSGADLLDWQAQSRLA